MKSQLPESIAQSLHDFYLTVVRHNPDVILFEDPDTSTAAAGLPIVFGELQERTGLKPPKVIVANVGFATYFDLLDQMVASGKPVENTVVMNGYVADEQEDFLQIGLHNGTAPAQLCAPFSELQAAFNEIASQRAEGPLRVLAVSDFRWVEECPRDELANTIVTAACPIGRQIEITPCDIFYNYWQDEVGDPDSVREFRARRWENEYDEAYLAEQESLISHRLSDSAIADLSSILRDLGFGDLPSTRL